MSFVPLPAACTTCGRPPRTTPNPQAPLHRLPGGPRALHGHSLVECMVALAIAAVLLASALPSWHSLAARHWVDTHARALATDLRWTRSHAIARHQSLRLSIDDGAAGDCYVIHSGHAGDCRCGATVPDCRAGAVALKQVRLDSRLDLRATGAARSISFHPLRGTATPAGTITLVGPAGLSVRTIVNVPGRVRSCSAGTALPGYAAC